MMAHGVFMMNLSFSFFCHELNTQSNLLLLLFFAFITSSLCYTTTVTIQRFKDGEQPIHRAVRYADYALQQYFECAKKTTVVLQHTFVITADHTGPSIVSHYQTRTGIYEVPIVYFLLLMIACCQRQYETLRNIPILFPGILNYLHYPDN